MPAKMNSGVELDRSPAGLGGSRPAVWQATPDRRRSTEGARLTALAFNGLVIALVVTVLACRGEQPVTDSAGTRPSIAVEYVGAPQLDVRSAPNATAPVVTVYRNGETVSVLSRKDNWTEVRTATGSGWTLSAGLTRSSASTTGAAEPDNLTPRFKHAPDPVSQPGTRGEIVLEANVTSDGVVLSVRTISNSTGSSALEFKNSNELRRATFHPIVQHGKRVPFTYEYRVHY